MTVRRAMSVPLSLMALMLGSGIVIGGGGAVTSVEAGAYRDFVAPDSGTATPGSITFGFAGTPEVIAAGAELVPPADTNLASLGGGAPTCLEVTREAGAITRIAFAGSCTVTGTVTFVPDAFGPGADGYLIADRVIAPADLITGDPAFGALIGAPAASGGTLAITFTVDLTTGIPSAFAGVTTVSGPVTMSPDGDVSVGAATLDAAVIDDAARALLAQAAALGVDATVEIDGEGSIDPGTGQPLLNVSLSVTFTAPLATPAATPGQLPNTGLPRTEAPSWAWLAIPFLTLSGAVAVRRRWGRS